MATIVVQTEINATVEKVWEVISDIDNEPKFWKGTKEVKTLSTEGGVIRREITIAFRDQKCLQEIQLKPKEAIKAKFTKGILDGTKNITLTPKSNSVILETSWDIKLSFLMCHITGTFFNIMMPRVNFLSYAFQNFLCVIIVDGWFELWDFIFFNRKNMTSSKEQLDKFLPIFLSKYKVFHHF